MSYLSSDELQTAIDWLEAKWNSDANPDAIVENLAIYYKEPFPANCNVFHHDMYHMGTQIAENLVVMHSNSHSEKADYVIIVNPITGRRLKLDLTDF